MTSSVAREMMPAVIEVRTTEDRSRANPEEQNQHHRDT